MPNPVDRNEDLNRIPAEHRDPFLSRLQTLVDAADAAHYVGHSFSEGGRNHAPVNLGWRELNNTFPLPFEMAVKLANAGSVMPAYHDIDGEPTHASHHLLTDVLRGRAWLSMTWW